MSTLNKSETEIIVHDFTEKKIKNIACDGELVTSSTFCFSCLHFYTHN